MVTLIVVIIGIILLAEGLFQLLYRMTRGAWYRRVEKIRLAEMFVEPHPFLTLANKKNFRSAKSVVKARYPLHRSAGFSYPPVRTNNFRHLDGPNGDRPIVMPKPKGQVRVLCLGASTTGNYIHQNGVSYSYPLALEGYLQRRYPDLPVVVHNCGQGGWTSAEILVNFMLNLRDTRPDVVVIYHAYNDLPASLTGNFSADYSHARQNLAASYYKYRWASLIPMPPLGICNFAIQKVFPFLNPRFGVLDAISTGTIDLASDFKGLDSYERNLDSIMAICRADGVDVVLSTFAHYLYDGVRESRVHLKYREGLDQENQVIRGLALKYRVPLVDNARLVPEDARYFVDSIHFTPEGMQLISENIGPAVAQHIENRLKKPETPRTDNAGEAVHLHSHI